MTVINTNYGGLISTLYAARASDELDSATRQVASGLRVNSAADDAAGLAVSNRLEVQTRSMDTAIRNASDGISLIQTAESAMDKVNSMLLRMRELSVQMGNGIYSDSDRQNAQQEVILLQEEIDKISTNIQFNQVNLLDGSYSSQFRVGSANDEVISLDLSSVLTEDIGQITPSPDQMISETATASVISSSHIDAEMGAIALRYDEGAVSLQVADMGTALSVFTHAYSGGSYSLSGDDSSLFSVNSVTGEVSGNIDFEALGDADADNDYSLRLTYQSGTHIFRQDITLQVADIDDSNSYITDSAGNSSAITPLNVSSAASGTSQAFRDFIAADTDGSGSYSLTGTDADLASLQIDSQTGIITTQSGTTTEQGIYKFDVRYTASDGSSHTEHITLTTGYTAPTEDTATTKTANTTMDVIGSRTGYIINATSLSDRLKAFVALDNDSGSFSIAGTNASYFQLTGTDGTIAGTTIGTTAAADGNIFNISSTSTSSFELLYTASDGTVFTETITLNTSYGDLTAQQTAQQSSASSLENTATSVLAKSEGSVSVTLAEMSERLRAYAAVNTTGFSYSLSGTDAADFSINSTTGEVTASLTFATPADDDENNIYEFDVEYSDGTDTFTETVILELSGTSGSAQTFVTDNDNAVSIGLSDLSSGFQNFDTNKLIEYELDSTDPDVIAARVSIDADTGAITSTSTPTGVYEFDATAKIKYSDQWSSGTNIDTTNKKYGSGALQTAFTGAVGSIEVSGSDFNFGSAGSFTAEAWIRPTDLSDTKQIIFDFRESGSRDLPVVGFDTRSMKLGLYHNDTGLSAAWSNSAAEPIIGGSPFLVSGYTGNVRVHVEVDNGFISLQDTSGITLSAPMGYSSADWTSGTAKELVFAGSQAAVNNALRRLVHTGAAGTITVTHNDNGIAYNPDNQHFYDFISGNFEYWEADANGDTLSHGIASGYLATVTSQAEWDFITDHVHNSSHAWISGADGVNPDDYPGFLSIFYPAADAAQEGDFYFTSGPEDGTTFWTGGQGGNAEPGFAFFNSLWTGVNPDNFSNEDGVHLVNGGGGINDIDETNKFGYIVEYGTDSTKSTSFSTSDLSSSFLSENQWHHVALVRDGSTLELFVDGVSAGTSNYAFTFNNSSNFRVSGNPSQAGYGFNGQMDSIRVQDGVAVYTADFNPSTAITSAFTADARTVFLANFDGNYSLDEAITLTAGHNPTAVTATTKTASTALTVAGSQTGYRIDGSVLSDRLKAYLATVTPGSFSLGGADAGYFTLTTDGTIAGTQIVTNSTAIGNIVNTNTASSSTFTLSDGVFTETITLNVSIDNEPTVQTASLTSTEQLETSAVNLISRLEENLTVTASDYSEKLRAFAAMNSSGFSYSLSPSASDSADFSINSTTGEITAQLNFEDPADADLNNIYHLDVTYSDGSLTFTETIEFTLTDLLSDNSLTLTHEALPELVPYHGTAITEMSVIEAETNIIDLNSLSDRLRAFIDLRQGGELSLGGADAALFSFESQDGTLPGTVTTLDGLSLRSDRLTFERRRDHDQDQIYELEINYSIGEEQFTESIRLRLDNDSADDEVEVAVSDISLSSQDDAEQATLVLDRAINQISRQQARMGAAQNRLEHNIDNLSTVSMLTSRAQGRIIDADYAKSTAELARIQILGNAAQNMLATANQSKQMLLSLLR